MRFGTGVLPASRLGLAIVCVAGLCCPAVAGDGERDPKVVAKFRADMEKVLALMRTEGPQVKSVTDDEIVISSIHQTQCSGQTHPNHVTASAFQNSVNALNAINNAVDHGKKIKITTVPLELNCMDMFTPVAPHASSEPSESVSAPAVAVRPEAASAASAASAPASR